MTRQLGSERARIEKEQRRKAFYSNTKPPKINRIYHEEDGDGFFQFSEYWMRRLAPIAILIHAFTLLFFVTWLVSLQKRELGSTSFLMGSPLLGQITIPEANELYLFEISQTFPGKVQPLYSELEIELLDENYDHVYSFYKDLWQELHPNGEGAYQIYSDNKLTFEIELPKAGTYYIRGISHNNNVSAIYGKVYKKLTGGIYYFIYFCAFGSLSLLLLLGSGRWGNPFAMLGALSKIRDIRQNKLFLTLLVVFSVLYLGSVITGILHYGYAQAGEDSVLPTYFYLKDNVIYLG